MVDLTRIVKDYRDSGAVHSFVNLYGFISDSLLLTKSGDVGVVLKVEPHDYESLDRDELAEVTDRFEASLRSFDHRFRIYQYAFKRNGAHIPPQTHSADAIVTQALRDRARYLEAKGGVAMELRFAEHARATKDLDLGMEGTRADPAPISKERHWEQDSMSSHSGSKLKRATWNRQTRFASRWRFNIERDHGRRLRLTSAPPKPIKSI